MTCEYERLYMQELKSSSRMIKTLHHANNLFLEHKPMKAFIAIRKCLEEMGIESRQKLEGMK